MTPTAPDFDQIARRLFDRLVEAADVARMTGTWNPSTFKLGVDVIVSEELRLTWNARGAADLVKLQSFRLFPEDDDEGSRGATRKTLDRALRTLDR